ncbi:hypothetical protein CFOL_v3_02206 [Cephalotus follicularis]|uniref:Uncharacterized protein n=1 Tax=Cephalotus follicularis TaxID=3775 RepID=A0A1Q3ASX5_CEPFO|nr:hypothetical protein CFOL_v3_02206 [Cephalotus follicularis]
MNTTSTSFPDLVQENASGSDSDTNPDDTSEYYQPISDTDYFDDQQVNSDEEHHSFQASDSEIHRLPNGYRTREAEDGIASLDLNDDVEDAEEMMMGDGSDLQIVRAFREDESRRNAPLTAENAVRVMEAMRGVSFVGLPPDWAHTVPEHRWIHQLRRRSQPPQSPTSS